MLFRDLQAQSNTRMLKLLSFASLNRVYPLDSLSVPNYCYCNSQYVISNRTQSYFELTLGQHVSIPGTYGAKKLKQICDYTTKCKLIPIGTAIPSTSCAECHILLLHVQIMIYVHGYIYNPAVCMYTLILCLTQVCPQGISFPQA